MKAKKNKCHLLINGSENITINVDGNIMGKSVCEKILAINVDYKHLDSTLKNAGRKVLALLRIFSYMNLKRRRVLMNLLFTSKSYHE